MFKKLVKECFPKEYEQASSNKEEKKRLQSMWAQPIMDELERDERVREAYHSMVDGDK